MPHAQQLLASASAVAVMLVKECNFCVYVRYDSGLKLYIIPV